jgi:hypothetical protein
MIIVYPVNKYDSCFVSCMKGLNLYLQEEELPVKPIFVNIEGIVYIFAATK